MFIIRSPRIRIYDKNCLFLYSEKKRSLDLLIGLLIFTVLLLMDKILKLIELIAGESVFQTILMLLIYISPSFLVFTIPMALLLGIYSSFGRLSGDSEITAFKVWNETFTSSISLSQSSR